MLLGTIDGSTFDYERLEGGGRKEEDFLLF